MIRSNVDVIAVSVLIAAAALFSAAQQSPAVQKVSWDILSSRTALWQCASRSLTIKNRPTVKVVRQVTALSCLRD
jgi:hypothetical protein